MADSLSDTWTSGVVLIVPFSWFRRGCGAAHLLSFIYSSDESEERERERQREGKPPRDGAFRPAHSTAPLGDDRKNGVTASSRGQDGNESGEIKTVAGKAKRPKKRWRSFQGNTMRSDRSENQSYGGRDGRGQRNPPRVHRPDIESLDTEI